MMMSSSSSVSRCRRESRRIRIASI
jgi:hypothetical protein